MQNRRKKSQPTEKELYKKPNIRDFIEKERREKELKKLKEVQTQGAIWTRTFIMCLLLNLAFIALALVGMYSK